MNYADVQLPEAIGQSRYATLALALRARIVSGDWPPGSALPTEQRLAAEHGVALGTLRHALALLTEQGLIERHQGRGTFVRAGLGGAPMLRFFRFGGASDSGGTAVPTSAVLSAERQPAKDAAARRLGIAPGDPVLQLLRLRSLDGRPCLLEEITLPLPRFEALAALPAGDWPDLFYPLYAQRCGTHVHRAVDEIAFGTASAMHASHLQLPPGHPCARVTRCAYDVAGRCVEFRITHGDAHAFHYSVTIT